MTRKTTTKKPSQLDRIDKRCRTIDVQTTKHLVELRTKLGAMDAFVSTTLPAMFKEFRTMESKLDLLLKGSDFMKEIGEKEEPWVPVVGQPARCDGLIFLVEDHKRTVGEWWMIDSTWRPTHHLSKPSPAEVQKYEEQVKAQEWAKVDELQDWDACECTKSEQADLWAMGSTFAYHATSDSLNLRWDPDYGRTKLVKTSRPDQFSPKHPLNWIPVAEFRRRLEGTISKRKAQEQEAKIAKLKFGTRVEYEDDRGWKVAMDKPTPDGLYVIVKEGHARMAWAKASQLTLIDP